MFRNRGTAKHIHHEVQANHQVALTALLGNAIVLPSEEAHSRLATYKTARVAPPPYASLTKEEA
jgi:hypothetical protein